MSLRDSLEQELQQLAQQRAAPATLQVQDTQGVTLRLEVSAIDSMSVEFLELTLFVPALQQSGFTALQQWATDLSQRITYLLENLGPLEFDPQAGEVLIRSNPPGKLTNGSQYYEIILSSVGNGTFSLKRFRSIQGTPGRDHVPIRLTHEVLLRLVDDLLDTIP